MCIDDANIFNQSHRVNADVYYRFGSHVELNLNPLFTDGVTVGQGARTDTHRSVTRDKITELFRENNVIRSMLKKSIE